jgi:hypothetical protein
MLIVLDGPFSKCDRIVDSVSYSDPDSIRSADPGQAKIGPQTWKSGRHCLKSLNVVCWGLIRHEFVGFERKKFCYKFWHDKL